MTGRSLFTALALFIIVGTAVTVYAYNERLISGGFEDGAAAWDIVVLNSSLQLETAPVRSGSHSGRIALGTNQTVGQIGQSISLTAPGQPPLGNYFTMAGWIYVPESETNFQSARVRVRYYETSGCAFNPILYTSPFIPISNRDEWIPFEFITAIPADKFCVTPLLEVSGINTNEPLNVYWDDISLYDSGPTAATLTSLSVGADGLSGWGLWLGLVLLALLITAWIMRQRQSFIAAE